jgi:copper chaperone CopZ
MTSLCRFPLLLLALLCSIAPLLHAEEQSSTYRLIGLFDTTRPDDFRDLLTAIPELKLTNLDFEKDEVTLRYDLPSIFTDGKVPKDLSPEKLMERLNNLIGSRSGKHRNTFKLAALSRLLADQQTRVDIKIGILDCKGCRYGVYQIVNKIDGVERVTVSVDSPTVTAWIDPAKTNREAIEAALKKAQVSVPSATPAS